LFSIFLVAFGIFNRSINGPIKNSIVARANIFILVLICRICIFEMDAFNNCPGFCPSCDYVVKYVTLLKLHGNSTLLRSLDSLLGNDAILQLDLKSLKPIFREEPEKESWYHEVLDNNMKLWELNMPQSLSSR